MQDEYKKLLYATLFILVAIVSVVMAIIMILAKDFELFFVPLILFTIAIYGCCNRFSIDLPFLKINVEDKEKENDE